MDFYLLIITRPYKYVIKYYLRLGEYAIYVKAVEQMVIIQTVMKWLMTS